MEDFVTYEIAVKLKEKGFKEKCIAYYWENINEHTSSFVVEDNMPDEGICIIDLLSEHNKAEWSPFIDAPTISQVLKWLREEHHIHFEIVGAAYGYNLIISDTPDKGGTDRYFSHVNYDGTNDGGAWDSYEECVLYGIEYVLDNLI